MIKLHGYTLSHCIREGLTHGLFRGRRSSDGVPVLVKALRGDHPSAGAVARLRYEYTLLKSLEAPGVARALALEPAGNGFALVLEDVGERSLDRVIHAERLPLETLLRVAVSMASTLETIQRSGLIHKDIRPLHFFVDADGNETKLVDFGAATRLTQDTARIASLSAAAETLAYVSPEQTGRMNQKVDARTDLYSLGVTLYELFTGTLPFATTDPVELVHSHIARTPTPPHEVRPEIPRVLSEIVLKLLAKVPDERYQSAAGLKADLQSCLERVDSPSELMAIRIGQGDVSEQLRVPQKLYGREAESAAVLAAFERVHGGAIELMLVAGHSGIGKSALVHEMRRSPLHEGYFVAGKFDQLSRSTPYAAIAEACRGLVRAVLAETPETHAAYRQSLGEALGPNGRVLIDLVPQLELIVGPQPAVQELGPTEAQHRLELVLQNFLQVFATTARAVVFFLDDLQWADSASLHLIQRILTAPGAGHLLVIGAYRDNEVDPVHPFSLAVREMRKGGAAIHELKLKPLPEPVVTQLVADTLRTEIRRAEPLAALLVRKTHGNPFFLGQFLTALHRDKLLSLDPRTGTWTWDLERIEQAMVTDNVVDFMVTKLQNLSAQTQLVLRLAACVGHRFDHQTLVLISEQPAEVVTAALWESLHEQLLLPLEGGSEYLELAAAPGTSDDAETPINAGFRFSHDRVQQAAYALIDDAKKREVHLRIGRLMMARRADAPEEHELFEVVNHMNLGSDLIHGAKERRGLASLNLEAARRAKEAAAHDVATELAGTCLELLGDDPWSESYELAYAALLTRAECASVNKNLQVAFQSIERLLHNAKSPLDQAAALELKLTVLTNMNRVGEAAECGVEAAGLLGMVLPREQAQFGPAIGEAAAELEAALIGKEIETLVDQPEMTDPRLLALLSIFAKTCPAANQTNPALTALICLKGVTLLLRHGNAPVGSYLYAFHGVFLGIMKGDFDAGYRFGRLAIRLDERAGAASGATRFLFGCFVSPWRKHLSEGIEYLNLALKTSLDSGDYIHVGYSASFGLAYRFLRGDNLDDLKGDLKSHSELLARTGDVINSKLVELVGRTIAALQKPGGHGGSLLGEDLDDSEFRRQCVESGNRALVGNYHLFRATLLNASGDYEGALTALDAFTEAVIPGFFFVAEHRFQHALALAGKLRFTALQEREPLVEALRKDVEEISRWAEVAPENHAHRRALLQAELSTDDSAAGKLYDHAIALANEHGFIQHQALANELCGSFHGRQGRGELAKTYLAEARYAYLRWGASAKVQELARRHAGLGVGETSAEASGRDSRPSAPAVNELAMGPAASMAGRLDMATMLRVTQAIVGELELEKLLERLMRSLVANAGAQRGLLVLNRDGKLQLEAVIEVDPDVVRLGLGQDMQTCPELAGSVVQYVARSHTTVVLDGAASDERFSGDSYLTQKHPKSLLCTAMVHQGRLAGVLYLENNVATRVFSPDRVELLQVLAAQAAVALENAKLYGDLRAATDQLKRANETLEVQVAERTRELSRTVAELWSEMDLARKIQTVLLPRDLSMFDYQIAATQVPAASVGGDYYDSICAHDTKWLLIGDVSGHGVTSGLSMMMIQTAVHTVVTSNPGLTPSQMLSRVNAAVRKNLQKVHSGHYMTLTALQLEGPLVRYAGLHQDILIHRAASGVVERVPTLGVWIGLVDDISDLLEDSVLTMNPEDVMLLFTDGIAEMPLDGQRRLGTDGVANAFGRLVAEGKDVQSIVQGMLSLAEGHTVDDDISVMAVRYAPHAAQL